MTRAITTLALSLILAETFLGSKTRMQMQTQAPPLSPLQDFDVRDIGFLDALIRLGELYDNPMGIIFVEKKLVARKVTVKTLQASVQQALAALTAQLPEYAWSESNGVLLVRPRVLPPQTQKMLDIVMPRIFAESIDIDSLSNRLWMEVQIQADPESRSRGFMMHSHAREYYELGRIDFTNVRIDEVLSEIVRRRRSAAWVLLPPPEELKGARRATGFGAS